MEVGEFESLVSRCMASPASLSNKGLRRWIWYVLI